ncbi:uncharacterized protein LOC122257067 [Penaeus japonicus]|uniref:uncharacterized protein LOC122257067 n=1 Tax=Penaeus japonicus TaxID=27405 RepID=UPI001C712F9C|nr:uncharacterized protein LOC122257067 [Penaeus japonicus]
MTWMTVALTLVLPLVIRGCEVATIGDYIDVPLQKNGDSWTASVGVNPTHSDAWQLNLDLSVNSKHRTTYVMKLTLSHISDGLIRLKGPFGNEDFTGDDTLLVLKNQFLNLTVTVSQHELKLETETKDETAIHGLESFHDIETSTLGLRNIEATENFKLSFGCVEVNARTASTSKYTFHPTVTGTTSTLEYTEEHRTYLIAALLCGALVLVAAAIFVCYRASRRRREGSAVNKSPAVFYVVQSPERSNCSLAYVQLESTNNQLTSDHNESDSAILPSLNSQTSSTLCRGNRRREVVASQVSAEHPAVQSKDGFSENVYESITDIDVSADEHSSSNSTYEAFSL